MEAVEGASAVAAVATVGSRVAAWLAGREAVGWGVAAKEFIGYWQMSDNGLVNWYGGVEFWQARTWPQRPMNFDTQLVDEGPRFDAFAAVKLGWVFHIYKRTNPEHWN